MCQRVLLFVHFFPVFHIETLSFQLVEKTSEFRRDHDGVVVAAARELRERFETAQPLRCRVRVLHRGLLEIVNHFDLKSRAFDFRLAFALRFAFMAIAFVLLSTFTMKSCTLSWGKRFVIVNASLSGTLSFDCTPEMSIFNP